MEIKTMQVGNRIIETDPEGFLIHRTDWHEEIAYLLAKQEGIILSEAHFELIYFVREFYEQYHTTPAIRALIKAIALQWGPEKGNSLYVHRLFPKGPAKQISKIAGLPKPVKCI